MESLRDKKKSPRIDPLWTLEDGVTYSILSKFDVCPHRFHIGQVQGWKPKKISLPLEFGNIFHMMDEAYGKKVPLELVLSIPTRYVELKTETSNADIDTIKELSYMAAACKVTFEHYKAYWEQNPCFEIKDRWYYEKDFHWIGKEVDFDVKYTMPNGRVIRLRGKRDGEFNVTRKIAGNWLFETKTKGTIDEDGITRGLHKDLQTGIYMTSQQIERGVYPKGVLYNVIRRTGMKPRTGGKSAKGESPLEFAARLEEDIKKRPQYYFMRWVRRIDEHELKGFQERQLNPALFRLTTWWDSIKRNPMHPFETNCPICECGVLVVATETRHGRKFHQEDCKICDGKGTIQNMHHYERPFGQYDSMSHGRGDFFDIVTDQNYFMFEQKESAFPELEEEDVNQYLVQEKV